jgi:hypothetical protein
MIKHFPFLAVALTVSLTASAQNTKRIPLTASQNPPGADLPFSAVVWDTKDQPSKPACTTVQVVLPAGDRGALMEIDFVVVRPK